MYTTTKAVQNNGVKRETTSKTAPPVSPAGKRHAIPVLAIDDDPSFLYVLGQQLQQVDGRRITFEQARTAEQAVTLLAADRGNKLILMDHRLNGKTDGLGLLKQLRHDGDHRPVIVMTAYGDEYTAAAMIKNGADDYLVKSDIDADRLARTIERVMQRWRLRRGHDQQCHAIRQRVKSLTPREREVLDAIVSGLTNRQIAAEFFRSEKTIKVHRANLMAKMQAGTPAELARLLLTVEPARTKTHAAA